jgi:hypothetical protein
MVGFPYVRFVGLFFVAHCLGVQPTGTKAVSSASPSTSSSSATEEVVENVGESR